MYCQEEFQYQMPADYQQYTGPPVAYQPNAFTQCHGDNISPYNTGQPTDRPAPSFRIEDIILRGDAKTPGLHSYGGVYPPGLHYPSYPNGNSTHGCLTDKDYQGMNQGPTNSMPVYFRLKSTLRTASGRKCRKPRTVFSELQLMVLEREFSEHKYLSTPQRTKLADRLGLNQTQVKTWYQNRRMKWKKESSEEDSKQSKVKTASPEGHCANSITNNNNNNNNSNNTNTNTNNNNNNSSSNNINNTINEQMTHNEICDGMKSLI